MRSPYIIKILFRRDFIELTDGKNHAYLSRSMPAPKQMLKVFYAEVKASANKLIANDQVQ